MKTWVKLYTKINRDPDMGTLTWAQRGIWQALLALCGEIDDRDDDEKETGRLDTIERVAWSIRCDEEMLSLAVAAFEERGMVTRNSDVLYLTNYPRHQARPPSARPSAVAKRVKRHRAKAQAERNEDVTPLHRGVTPSDPDPEEIQIREDPKSPAEDGGADAPTTFQQWATTLQESTNRQAVLVQMFTALYPGRDPPSYGYIGKVARQVGGAGRLADLLWQNSTRPPTGDVLSYVQQVAKGGKRGTGNGTDRVNIQGHIPTAATPEEFYGDDD